MAEMSIKLICHGYFQTCFKMVKKIEIKSFCFLAALLFSPLIYADKYRQCDIRNGDIGFCSSWYNGETVAYKNGAYRKCRVNNGQAGFCSSWYNGIAVVYKDGKYRKCNISNGRIRHCSSWYNGKAVVIKNT